MMSNRFALLGEEHKRRLELQNKQKESYARPVEKAETPSAQQKIEKLEAELQREVVSHRSQMEAVTNAILVTMQQSRQVEKPKGIVPKLADDGRPIASAEGILAAGQLARNGGHELPEPTDPLALAIINAGKKRRGEI